MIINIRGMNGSGKTYAVRGLLGSVTTEYTFAALQSEVTRFGNDPLPGTWEDYAARENDIVATVSVRDGVYIAALGRYDRPTGGCDGINKQDHTTALVTQLSLRFDVVVFEGIMVSMTYQRWADAFSAAALYGVHSIIAYLDPTMEECERYIGERRATSVVTRKPFNRILLHDKEVGIARTRVKFEEAGFDVRPLPRSTSVETLLSWAGVEQAVAA